MRLDMDAVIVTYQLIMMQELMHLWHCDKQEFLAIEKEYDLFRWIRKNYEYLQGYGNEFAAEDIDHYVNEECRLGAKFEFE